MQVQRQAIVQKSNVAHSGNRAPAAPTSPQPPFHFGSPDGVPAKYANRTDELTQERLKIPPKKKRRGSTSMSIPAQTQSFNASKSPQLAETAPALTEKPLNEAPIKCQAPECTDRLDGFVSQADLDKHVLDNHDPEEPTIEDPLQWTLEQMRYALGLDENGQPHVLLTEPKDEHISEATKMKKLPSAQGQTEVKQESATPMTRVPTQTGPSPGSSLLKTPQPSANLKTPGSEAKSAAKDVNAVEPKPLHSPAQKHASTSPDPWATSRISADTIRDMFSDIPGLPFSDTWSTIQPVMTPSSTLSSGISEKTSPQVSDISENDAAKTSQDTDSSDHFDWFATPDDYLNDSEIEDMDWESSIEMEGPREGRPEDMETPREWLKIYAPEKLSRKQP